VFTWKGVRMQILSPTPRSWVRTTGRVLLCWNKPRGDAEMAMH
jgi:hypothetical protein